MATTILETSLISPPANSGEEITVPLTFFDMPWTIFGHPIRRLLFYRQAAAAAPSSKAFFLDTVAPKLKESLSLALKHYLPAAGKLVYPLTNRDGEEAPKFYIRYRRGDAVPFTVAESEEDFDELVGNHPRDADRFYAYVPQMPPFEEEEEPPQRTFTLLAIQVTLFPGRGLCIGFSNDHCLGDANSMVRFIKAWASVSKLGGGDEGLDGGGISSLLPLFDRSAVRDPLGIENVYWGTIKHFPLKQNHTFPLPTNRFRATFVLDETHVKKMKKYVLAQKPTLAHVSSFVVATSYAWSCLVKSGEKSAADDDEVFGFAVDVRSRADPPIPDNYFGNCVGHGKAFCKSGDFFAGGGGGFVLAAERISECVKERVNDRDELWRAFPNMLSDWLKLIGKNMLGVSGSPRFDLYEVDFGFGRAEKVEVLSIDGEKYSMSLSKSRDFEGGVEIGFSLPKERMEAFRAIFEGDLKKIMMDAA